MKKLNIEFGLGNNQQEINVSLIKTDILRSENNCIKSDKYKIIENLLITELKNTDISLNNIKKILINFNTLISMYNMSWIELLLTFYSNDKKFYLRTSYLGGFLKINGIDRPIGVSSEDISNLVLSFFDLLYKLKYTSKKLTSIKKGKSEFTLDEFSSGIFLHELYGHTSEIDINKKLKTITKNINLNFSIFDEPSYKGEKDDANIIGKKINIYNNFLTYQTGNLFIYPKLNNVKENIGIIRQRKLTVNRKMTENCIPAHQCDLVISAGKLNLKQKSLEFIIKSKNLNLSYIDIPLCFINKITALGGKKIQYSTICKKQNYPAIVTLNMPKINVNLKKPIKEFIKEV